MNIASESQESQERRRERDATLPDPNDPVGWPMVPFPAPPKRPFVFSRTVRVGDDTAPPPDAPIPPALVERKMEAQRGAINASRVLALTALRTHIADLVAADAPGWTIGEIAQAIVCVENTTHGIETARG